MLVCHCLALHVPDVRAAVASGARTVDEVVARCGAGGRCGGCRPIVAEVIAEVGIGLPARQTAAA